MPAELGKDVIEAVHNALATNEQIIDLSLSSKLHEISLAHNIFKRVRRAPDLDKALQKEEECSEQDKLLIGELIQKDRQKQLDLFDYKLNIILSNDSTFKSLVPKIEMRIKDQEVELSVDEFSNLRYEVARTIHRIQHYLY